MLLVQIFTDDIRAVRHGALPHAAGSDWARVLRLADRAARSAVPVLIQGEPGSGAQGLARAIHDAGERRQRSFVRLHAGDLTEHDGSSILHKRLQEAHGGTLLVQDIKELAAPAQERLFEALHPQDMSGRAGRRGARTDVRIIASTGVDLSDPVRQGRFREDLFYRLQALPISLRPLRGERDPILAWAGRFLKHFAAEEAKPVQGLSVEAENLLTRYDWPGNLRQLETTIFRAVILADGLLLRPSEFPQIAAHVPGYRVEIPPAPQPKPPAPIREFTQAERRDPHALALVNETGEMPTLAELEAQVIRFALVHYQGQLSAISRRLGIGRSTLYRKLKELGLDDAAA
jgi:DNA-binding NtrC family response regulator